MVYIINKKTGMLVNIPSGSLWQTNITMENHHVQNENQRYMTWPFSIAMSNFQWACVSEVMVPKGIPKPPWLFHEY